MKTVIRADRNIVRETKINMSMCVVLHVILNRGYFSKWSDFKGRPEGARSPSHEPLLFRFCLQKDKHLLVFLSPFSCSLERGHVISAILGISIKLKHLMHINKSNTSLVLYSALYLMLMNVYQSVWWGYNGFLTFLSKHKHTHTHTHTHLKKSYYYYY